jgi:hypothetical protein
VKLGVGFKCWLVAKHKIFLHVVLGWHSADTSLGWISWNSYWHSTAAWSRFICAHLLHWDSNGVGSYVHIFGALKWTLKTCCALVYVSCARVVSKVNQYILHGGKKLPRYRYNLTVNWKVCWNFFASRITFHSITSSVIYVNERADMYPISQTETVIIKNIGEKTYWNSRNSNIMCFQF